MKPLRLDAKSRRRMIVDAAQRVALTVPGGVMGLTPENVAAACEVPTSPATVRRYFLTMAELREALHV